MNRKELIALIEKKKSFLCVGLDTDLNKIPSHLLKEEDPVFEFNKKIIDATLDLSVAYKPNLAFYEAIGIKGLISLKKTMDYLNKKNGEVFTIADAKRGDIGNTSQQYAKAFLSPEGDFNFDSMTIAPYMGEDSVLPFIQYETSQTKDNDNASSIRPFKNKWVILLALTSNKGAFDFQFIEEKKTGKRLFEIVLEASKKWGTPDNMMYVVGATQAESLGEIRKIVPENLFLVPGVGAQGGSLQDVCRYGMTKDCGLLVNASRSIIYASAGEDFAEKAREEALRMQKEMEVLLQQR